MATEETQLVASSGDENNDTTENYNELIDVNDDNGEKKAAESGSDNSQASSPRSPKSPSSATNKLGLTKKEMTDLKILYKEDIKQWRQDISKIMREKSDVFGTFDFGEYTSGDKDYITEDEFKSHFKGTFDDEMIGLIWKDLEKTKENGVTVMAVHRWINLLRRPTVAATGQSEEEPHNEKWLYNKLKNLTFVEVDDGRVGYLTKDVFLQHFKKEGVSNATALKVFRQIDKDGNGTVSVKEFITWQHNFTKTEFKSMHELPFDLDLGDLQSGDENDNKNDEDGDQSAIAGPADELEEEDVGNDNENENENENGNKPQNYKGMKRIWVKSVNSGKWRECAILSEKRKKIKVHYLSFNSKYDEWLLTSSDRVSENKPNDKISEGDIVSVYAKQQKEWVIGEINNVSERTNRIQINYIGMKDKQEWLQITDLRVSLSIKEPDDPL